MRSCEREIEKLRLDNKVRFLGSLSIGDIQAELTGSSCLAMPSFQENAPLAIEEAMAAGVPVVGAKVGGIPEMVEHGRTGFLVDPYNTNEIAQAILAVLRDGALAQAMSSRARQIAGERFRAAAVCKQTRQVYEEILSGARREERY